MSNFITMPLPLGCLSCRGDAGAETTVAANFAILAMLVVLVFILGSILYFMFYLARRAKMIAKEDEALAASSADSNLSGTSISS